MYSQPAIWAFDRSALNAARISLSRRELTRMFHDHQDIVANRA
jgi:hypothetical protein